MKRRFPVLGAVLILVGVAGLASLSVFQGGLWGDASWPMGPWGAGSMVIGPGMMRGMGPGMMGGALPSDIRYEALTKEEHREGEKAREHPPYTDDLIKRAITRGVDPAGNSLDWTMPRWRMGDADFADLLAYLKTLR
ncbi:MAG: hypothetical protein HY766_14650 [candidate division NC10 bacterium]|nr:hypothetical protein [candidate division NC10 bacterium]